MTATTTTLSTSSTYSTGSSSGSGSSGSSSSLSSPGHFTSSSSGSGSSGYLTRSSSTGSPRGTSRFERMVDGREGTTYQTLLIRFCGNSFYFNAQAISRTARTACIFLLEPQLGRLPLMQVNPAVFTPNYERSPSEYYRYIRIISIHLGMPIAEKLPTADFICRLQGELAEHERYQFIEPGTSLTLFNGKVYHTPKSVACARVLECSKCYHDSKEVPMPLPEEIADPRVIQALKNCPQLSEAAVARSLGTLYDGTAQVPSRKRQCILL